MTADQTRALARGSFFAIPMGLIGAVIGAAVTGTLGGALFVATVFVALAFGVAAAEDA